MKRSSKLKLLLAAVGALVILIIIAILLLHTNPVRRYVLEQVNDYLHKNLGLDLSADSVHYNLVNLSAGIGNLAIRSTARSDVPPFMRARSIEVRLCWLPLFKGMLSVQQLQLEGLAIEVVWDENAQDNLPKLPHDETINQKTTARAPLRFLISRLQAKDCSLKLNSLPHQLSLNLPNWNLQLEGDSQTLDHHFRFEVGQSGILLYQDRSLPLRDLLVEGSLRKNILDLKQVLLNVEESNLILSGSIEDFSYPLLQLQIDTVIDLGRAAYFAGLEEEVSGKLTANSFITGPLNNLQISTELEGDDLGFRNYHHMKINAQAQWNQEANRIHIDTLQVRSPFGEIRSEADLALTAEAGSSRLTAKIGGLDLAAICRYQSVPIQIASTAAADAILEWPGLAIQNLYGSADIRLTATRAAPAEMILPISTSFSLNAKDARIIANVEFLEAMGSNWNGQISLESREKLGGQLQGKIGSLDILSSNLSALLGNEASSEIPKIAGELDFSIALSGTLDHPNLASSFESSSLSYATLTGVSLKSRLEYTVNQLKLDELSLNWQDQSISASGSIGLQGSSPWLDLVAAADHVSLAAIVNGLGQEIPVEGTFSLNSQIRGTFDNIDAGASFSASDLRAYGETVGNLTFNAQLKDNKVTLNSLELIKPLTGGGTGYFRANGSFDFDSAAYNIEAEGTDLKLTNLILPGNVPVKCDLYFFASGNGTIDATLLDVQLEVTNLLLKDQSFGSVITTAKLEGRQVELEVEAPRLKISSKANFKIDSPYHTQFDITAAGTDLSPLAGYLEIKHPFKGTLSAKLQGSGDLANWKTGKADLLVSELWINLAEQELRNKGPIAIEFDNEVVRILSAAIDLPGSKLNFSGAMPLDSSRGPGSLEANGNVDIGGLISIVPNASDFLAGGTLDLNAALHGSFTNAIPSLRLSIKEGLLYHPHLSFPIESISMDVLYEKGSVRLDTLSAIFGMATIQASAELPLGALPIELPAALSKKEGSAKFSLDLKELELLNFRNLANLDGTLSLKAEGEMPNIADLKSLKAQISFPELQFKEESLEIRQSIPTTLVIRDGIARIEQFSLVGPVSEIKATGQAQLTGKHLLEARISGITDLGILTLFVTPFKAQGDTRFEIAFNGEALSPELSGFVSIEDGQLALSTPAIIVDNLNAQLDLLSDRIQIEKFVGTVNGGSLIADGWIGYKNFAFDFINIDLSMSDAFLNFPEGLKTQLQGNLNVRSRDDFIVLGGQIDIVDGAYQDAIDLEGELFQYLKSGSSSLLIRERDPFLSRIRFNIGLAIQEPIVVNNNLAKLMLEGGLRLVGTFYQPGLTGRISLEPGGEIYFNNRAFLLERGAISFTNEARIEPDLDIAAKTSVSNYEINLSISGGAEGLSASFSSEDSLGDPLPEPDIISLLLTGRTLSEVQGAEVNVAREQALSYLASGVGGRLYRSLGFTQERIDPTLISAETNPDSRFTIGRDMTQYLKVISSFNLVDSRDQIYIVEAYPARRIAAGTTRQSNNTYRFDFRHDWQFGAAGGKKITPSAPRAPAKEIGSISFQGNTTYSNELLADKFKLDPGDKYDFFKVQKSLDRLKGHYLDQERLEARIRLNRDEKDQTVDLTVRVNAGPEIEFAYEGFALPGSVKEDIRKIWSEGLFDAQRVEDSVQVIRTFLVEEGYLQAQVTSQIQTPEETVKKVIFNVTPGVRFKNVAVEFQGVSAIPPEDLNRVLDSEKLTSRIYTKPNEVTAILSRYYRQKGFLEVEVEKPRYQLDGTSETGKVVIPIQEGPQYRIGQINFQGNQAFQSSELRNAIPVLPGTPYNPSSLLDSYSKLQELYWSKGYNDAVIKETSQAIPESDLVDVNYQITENQQGIIEKITIEGNNRTSKKFIENQMDVEPGDVLSYEKTGTARKSLYNTGAYSLVDIDTQPAISEKANSSTTLMPLELKVSLKEVRPFMLRYGFFYDTDRGPGFIADLINRNSLGSARVVGVRTRYDSELQELRGYFSQPLLRSLPLRTNLTAFARREPGELFITDRLGFSIQEEAHLKNNFILTAGYRYERTDTYDREPDSFFQIPTQNVAPLTMSLARDTRDDFLDASHGSFMSHAFEYAPSFLGSNVHYVKYLGQYFKYLPLSEPTEIPFSQEKKSRLVYAGAVRIGIASGLGIQDLSISERFFAGGGTTIRGFKQDEVGPKDLFFGDPVGGDALFILNNELRFPIVSLFDGVGFLDIGNVYTRLSDFNPFKVRKSAGLGLRVRTPYFLLRFDYGFKLQRQPEESRGRFFFSIGQAF